MGTGARGHKAAEGRDNEQTILVSAKNQLKQKKSMPLAVSMELINLAEKTWLALLKYALLKGKGCQI